MTTTSITTKSLGFSLFLLTTTATTAVTASGRRSSGALIGGVGGGGGGCCGLSTWSSSISSTAAAAVSSSQTSPYSTAAARSAKYVEDGGWGNGGRGGKSWPASSASWTSSASSPPWRKGCTTLRHQQFQQWNGVRRTRTKTTTTWQQGQGQGQGEPKTSDAAGALKILFGASAVAVLAAPVVSWVGEHVTNVDDEDGGSAVEIAHAQGDRDTKFRLSEVIRHDKTSTSKWVMRGTSVYDITDFVEAHPGGDVILRACGGSIDAYWKLFTIHNKPEVHRILDQYYIGVIDERDLDAEGNVNWCNLGNDIDGPCIDDPFKDDPKRDPALIVHTAKPCNAETPGKLLGNFITPLRLFFVRHHLWVPRIEPREHHLKIELSDGVERSYSIDDLKQKFTEHTITATLQCAGNRRAHMNASANGKTSGLPWDVGAIGTAEFTGVRLRDVLIDAGYDVDKACEACPQRSDVDRHIHFCASDTYEQSIPLQTALNPASDVLLAWKMNGEEMPRDHGGPLRAIVPGSVATRSVKWLGKVRLSRDESESNWHNRDYKCFGPNVRASELSAKDWAEAQSIQEMPVQSAITNITRSQQGDHAAVSVDGFAFSGGGRRIVRVDVSADGGKTWKQACLRGDEAKGARRWAWTLWKIDWTTDQLPTDRKPEFVVKAVDEGYNTQPQTFDAIWNFRGLLGNAEHRVPLQI